eukprot:m.173164 g.173164  ORF g.173164 m.173164 type:complete len:427 (-) comp13652_c0_seq1:554-1834(-)
MALIGFSLLAAVMANKGGSPGTDPNGPCGCGAATNGLVDNRPTSITFELLGGSATGGLNLQSGKGGSIGGTVTDSCGDITVACYNAKNGDALFTPRVVGFGGTFTVNLGSGTTELECTVSCSDVSQLVDVHTSCSKALFVGQDFGAFQVSDFPGVCSAPSAPVSPSPAKSSKGKSKGKSSKGGSGSNPNGPCGCGDGTNEAVDGRPDVVQFALVGGPATGGMTLQSGKGGSTGGDITAVCGPIFVVCQNRDTDEVIFPSQVIPFGSTFNVNTGRITKTVCVVSCTGAAQTVDIHTSCSKTLAVGQDFGALEVVDFPNVQCDGPTTTTPEPGRASTSSKSKGKKGSDTSNAVGAVSSSMASGSSSSMTLVIVVAAVVAVSTLVVGIVLGRKSVIVPDTNEHLCVEADAPTAQDLAWDDDFLAQSSSA